jgi:hypothetical protein
MSRFKHHPLVEVEWDDACGRTGWRPAEEYARENGVRTRSVGYRVRNDRDAVVLLQSQAMNGNYNDSIVIPRSMVRKVRVLRR